MTSRVWICIAFLTLVVAVGNSHKVERVVKPVNMHEVFR